MEKSITITLIIVVGILILGIAGFTVFSSMINPLENKISVTGQSAIKSMPDLVAIYFTSTVNAETSSKATEKNAEIVENLRTALIKKGLENKEIQTLNFNVYEDFDYTNSGRKSKGFIATQTIRVVISTEDSSKIGEVIDAGIEAGVPVAYINFELSQDLENEYKSESIKLAAEDARIKAESVAEGLNKKVGSLVSVSVNEFGYYPWRMYDAIAGATKEEIKSATTNIQPSEQEISSSVTAIFRIK